MSKDHSSLERLLSLVFPVDITDTDGVIYLVTPQDILFHVLPILKKHATQHSLPLQDIIDLLPHPLSKHTPPTLIKAICDCTPSTNPLVPDTYKLSTFRVLRILIEKVDALLPVLGPSIIAEFVDKPLALVLGQNPPSNIIEINILAKRKCAMDLISSNLDDEFTQLIHESTEYIPLKKTDKFLPIDIILESFGYLTNRCGCDYTFYSN
jgi:hypothetical protein